MKETLLLFGAGYSARAAANELGGRFGEIVGTTRSAEKAEALQSLGITAVIFDGQKSSRELEDVIGRATHILASIAPDETGDPVLNACRKTIANSPLLRWIGYLSTVGVYGNHDGAWVDENTPVKPVSKRSLQRVAAENAWQSFAEERAVPLAIFRLSGIYGPGRNPFINIEKGRSRRLIKPGQVFNRIHRDDIGSAVALAVEQSADGVFNITDDEPAPPQDVVTFAHELYGSAPPPPIDFEEADLSPMARSFYGENKRVSNARSKRILGMNYKYPNYRTALARMWEEDDWK